MPNKIHITMFGQFSISYRDKRLCENEYRGSKMISLLEYLISQRGREITQNELIDLLWSDSKNPANALKTLVHRTRAMLDEMIPCGGNSRKPQLIRIYRNRRLCYRFLSFQRVHKQSGGRVAFQNKTHKYV